MSALLGDVLQTGITFEFEGREWIISPMDSLGVLEHLERWVPRYANECVEVIRPAKDILPYMDQEGWDYYREQKEDHNQRVKSGYYRFPSEGFFKALNTSRGYEQLLYYSVRLKQKDFTFEMAKRLFKESEEKVKEVLDKLDEINNPKAQTKTTTNLSSSSPENSLEQKVLIGNELLGT